MLPLSGGRDSRTLLAFLVANGLRPRCVTWTTRSPSATRSPTPPSRACSRAASTSSTSCSSSTRATPIRRRSSAASSRPTRAATTRSPATSTASRCGATWQRPACRGSSGETSRPASARARCSRKSGRRQVGGVTPADYPEDHPLRKLELASQHWPARLRNGPREDLKDYRLRLSQDGYLPIILAGLNEPKARYVEIVNPHLSRQVIGTVRSLAPESRYRAAAYHRITDGLARAVPYARFSSTQSASDLLHRPDMHELIVRELVSPAVEQVLGADGALQVLTAMSAAAGERPRARARLKEVVKQASDVLPTNLATQARAGLEGPRDAPPRQARLQSAARQPDDRPVPRGWGRAQRMADFILACTRTGHPGIAAECLRRAALRLAPPEMPLREPLFVTATGIAAAVANPTAEGVFLRRGPRGEEESGAAPAGAICVGGLFGAPGAWWQVGARGTGRHLRPRPLGRGRRRAGQRHLCLPHPVVRAHRGRLPRLHLAARPGDAPGGLPARARGNRLLPLLGHPGTHGLLGRAPAAPAARRARCARPRGVADHAAQGAVRAEPDRGPRRRSRRPPARRHRHHLWRPQPATWTNGSCRSPAGATAGRCSPSSLRTACARAASRGPRAPRCANRSRTSPSPAGSLAATTSSTSCCSLTTRTPTPIRSLRVSSPRTKVVTTR